MSRCSGGCPTSERRDEQHDELHAEVEERRPGAREREDLPRQVDLLDQARVRDDGARAADGDLLEESHRGQAGEDEDREVGDAAGGAEEVPEHDEVDGELHQRPRQRPEESEGGVLVLRLEIAAHEEPEHLAVVGDVADGAPDAPRPDAVRPRRRCASECSASVAKRASATGVRSGITVQSYPRRAVQPVNSPGTEPATGVPEPSEGPPRSSGPFGSSCSRRGFDRRGRCSRAYMRRKSRGVPYSMLPAPAQQLDLVHRRVGQRARQLVEVVIERGVAGGEVVGVRDGAGVEPELSRGVRRHALEDVGETAVVDRPPHLRTRRTTSRARPAAAAPRAAR